MKSSRIGLSAGFALAVAFGAAQLASAPHALAQGSQTVADGNMTEPLPTTPDAIIGFRQAHYKWMGDTFDDMKKAIGAGADVTQFAPQAANMAAWARRIPTVFPAGTETGHNTKALPAVWSNRPVFEERAAALATQADKLSTVAATGDKAAFATQYQATGGACGACHREFRAR